MKDEHFDQAIACVKDLVLPGQPELYRSCDDDLDRVYGEAMNGNWDFIWASENSTNAGLCPRITPG